jgi:hypothetical protein
MTGWFLIVYMFTNGGMAWYGPAQQFGPFASEAACKSAAETLQTIWPNDGYKNKWICLPQGMVR